MTIAGTDLVQNVGARSTLPPRHEGGERTRLLQRGLGAPAPRALPPRFSPGAAAPGRGPRAPSAPGTAPRAASALHAPGGSQPRSAGRLAGTPGTLRSQPLPARRLRVSETPRRFPCRSRSRALGEAPLPLPRGHLESCWLWRWCWSRRCPTRRCCSAARSGVLLTNLSPATCSWGARHPFTCAVCPGPVSGRSLDPPGALREPSGPGGRRWISRCLVPSACGHGPCSLPCRCVETVAGLRICRGRLLRSWLRHVPPSCPLCPRFTAFPTALGAGFCLWVSELSSAPSRPCGWRVEGVTCGRPPGLWFTVPRGSRALQLQAEPRRPGQRPGGWASLPRSATCPALGEGEGRSPWSQQCPQGP